MKEEKVIVTFVCDNCGNKSNEFEQPHSIPYENSWVFLHEFVFKVEQKLSKCLHDKHFCSISCLIDYIRNKINEAKENFEEFRHERDF